MDLPDFLDDRDGEIRVTGHRISLWQLLWYYHDGYSAEMLREQFPTLSMAEIHKVLGFYWENRAELDAEWSKAREEMESRFAEGKRLDVALLRSRLETKVSSERAG